MDKKILNQESKKVLKAALNALKLAVNPMTDMNAVNKELIRLKLQCQASAKHIGKPALKEETIEVSPKSLRKSYKATFDLLKDLIRKNKKQILLESNLVSSYEMEPLVEAKHNKNKNETEIETKSIEVSKPRPIAPNALLPFAFSYKHSAKVGTSAKGEDFYIYAQKLVYYFFKSYQDVFYNSQKKIENKINNLQKQLTEGKIKEKKAVNKIKKLRLKIQKNAPSSVIDSRLKQFEEQYANYMDYIIKHMTTDAYTQAEGGNLQKEYERSMFLRKAAAKAGKIVGYIKKVLNIIIGFFKRLWGLLSKHYIVSFIIISISIIAYFLIIESGKYKEKTSLSEKEKKDTNAIKNVAFYGLNALANAIPKFIKLAKETT